MPNMSMGQNDTAKLIRQEISRIQQIELPLLQFHYVILVLWQGKQETYSLEMIIIKQHINWSLRISPRKSSLNEAAILSFDRLSEKISFRVEHH